MLVKIKSVEPLEDFKLRVLFDDGKLVLYDLNDDIKNLPRYKDLQNICGLYKNVQLDKSRTCVYWNDYIDLPSDTIYEYGIKL